MAVAARMAADLAVAVGQLTHPPLGLGGVGDGQVCEEAHFQPPLEVKDTG
jgi:hypothetical protein